MIDYYTYVYLDPRNGLPFYVGKGIENRNNRKMQKDNCQNNVDFAYQWLCSWKCSYLLDI